MSGEDTMQPGCWSGKRLDFLTAEESTIFPPARIPIIELFELSAAEGGLDWIKL